jgi:hypothetical protein
MIRFFAYRDKKLVSLCVLCAASASIYLSLSSDKVANGGVFKLSENANNTSDAKINTLKNYEAIAISYENNFREFMTDHYCRMG